MTPRIAGFALTLALAGCNTMQEPEAKLSDDRALAATAPANGLDLKIAQHAEKYNIPPRLLHRVVKRESNYNPAARNGPYWGLMQIRHDTAKGMGYSGPASGLLDADTNLRYAGAYLANAYRVSGGNEDRAVRLYAGGYYYEAKRKGILGQMIKAN
ncbi:MAG: lytic transglycosylase domain-containing protein [Proteobacteria bacterium]|nr:lytic transglycosylase domain-containing protein [Pseudomonadota bacterium]